jgi:AcrR family transcriptional regulator
MLGRKLDTKETIIDEAFREFLTNGYKGADVVAIAQRAGVTKGGLYYYFKSKGDLAAAVLVHMQSELGSRASSDLSSDLPFVFDGSLSRPRTTAVQSLTEVASVLVRLSTEVPRKQKAVHSRIEAIVGSALDRLTLTLQENQMNRPCGLSVSAAELSLVICSAVLGSVALSRMCRQRSPIEQVHMTLEQIVHGELIIERSSRQVA